MPKIEKPKLTNRGPAGLLKKGGDTLTNRGPAGLLKKAPAKEPEKATYEVPTGAKNRVADPIKHLMVDIGSLTLDPDNARVHPERNLKSIEDSLNLYGQLKPVVVRKQTRVVVAGNGTITAALALGWTKIAAALVEMTEVEAAGYGLADNRTAELAKWDFEVVARLDRLLQEANHASVGWTPDELEVLRAADWVPPPLSDEGFGQNGEKPEPLMVSFTPDQYDKVGKAIVLVREAKEDKELDQAECIRIICEQWLEM